MRLKCAFSSILPRITASWAEVPVFIACGPPSAVSPPAPVPPAKSGACQGGHALTVTRGDHLKAASLSGTLRRGSSMLGIPMAGDSRPAHSLVDARVVRPYLMAHPQVSSPAVRYGVGMRVHRQHPRAPFAQASVPQHPGVRTRHAPMAPERTQTMRPVCTRSPGPLRQPTPRQRMPRHP